MPELPEVQTIVDDLNRKITGDRIIDFWTDWEKSIKNPLAEFKKQILGKKIAKVIRRGKNLLFYIDNGPIMLVHLKMTGHLLVKNNFSTEKGKRNEKADNDGYFNDKVNQYIHHIWYLEGKRAKVKGKRMEFSDLRKFAKIRLLAGTDLDQDAELSQLGIEPLGKDFSYKNFEAILEKYAKKSIRDFLMEQSIIAGIGNIYASEILFEAGVLPGRKNKSLANQEKKLIYQAIKNVLAKAVKMRGTSDSDYRDTDGAPGGFQKVLKVYNREKNPCQRTGCTGVVKREKIKQRSAFFCESCQK